MSIDKTCTCSNFSSLPEEIIAMILKHVDNVTLSYSCYRVSRQWRRIVDPLCTFSQFISPAAAYLTKVVGPTLILKTAVADAFFNERRRNYCSTFQRKSKLHIVDQLLRNQAASSKESLGTIDRFHIRMNDFVIRAEMHNDIHRLYIEIFNQNTGMQTCRIRMAEDEKPGILPRVPLRTIQFLMYDELLVARLGWDNDTVQVLLCLHKVQHCFLNSFNNPEFPTSLLQAVTEYDELVLLDRHVVNTTSELHIGLANSTTKKKAMLEYNFDYPFKDQ